MQSYPARGEVGGLESLRNHAYNDYAEREDTYFGTRYVIEAPLLAPDNRKPLIYTYGLVYRK